MKNSLPIFLLSIVVTIISCSKNNANTGKIMSDPPLEGDWVMTLYIDSTTGTTETKAASYLHPNVYSGTLPYPPAGEVTMKISFSDPYKTAGTINGSGIMNGCSLGFSITPQRNFHRLTFVRTLAMDPPWGEYFFSYLPATNSYSFDGDSTLLMQSPSKTLIFKRM